MFHNFQIIGLPATIFSPLFDKTDTALATLGAKRMVVDAKPSFPCRVSLADAEIGETVILLPFKHHDTASPFQASGPIFVRQHVETARLQTNEIPLMLQHRLLSVRGYDAAGFMQVAKVVEGIDLSEAITAFFAHPTMAYIHIHNAKPGCFNCTVLRA
jgi:hypothetical protein